MIARNRPEAAIYAQISTSSELKQAVTSNYRRASLITQGAGNCEVPLTRLIYEGQLRKSTTFFLDAATAITSVASK
jgi:hypothetical protein